MALYADLDQDERDLVEAWDRDFRGWTNELARLIISGRALEASLNASGGPASIVATLDPGQEIPNTGGLAGARALTEAEWQALSGGLESFLTSYDLDVVRRNIAKASGPTAGL